MILPIFVLYFEMANQMGFLHFDDDDDDDDDWPIYFATILVVEVYSVELNDC